MSGFSQCLSLFGSHPEAVLKPFADHVEGDGVYAGVYRRHVDPNVVQHQEETAKGSAGRMLIFPAGSRFHQGI